MNKNMRERGKTKLCKFLYFSIEIFGAFIFYEWEIFPTRASLL